MSSKYSGVNLDSDEEEAIHPNIDERSYKEWRRKQREQRRRELEQRLEEINSVENPSEEMIEERNEIERILKPSYVCLDTESFRTPSEDVEKDYIQELEYLIVHNELDSFIELMNRCKINMEEFEIVVLHNLAEQIKEGNDVGGLILSKISLYVKYALSHGKDFLLKLRAQLTNKEKKRQFEEDCRRDFEETKKAFLEEFGQQGGSMQPSCPEK
ncbi:hypothetical protein EHEL_070610 [Encephalitozoon hellem ATCC 50504]|uniref:Cdc37 N-terminal domain-containing protein n=1 Tax=Encephalitozoon hellem TaxID=27973 RepID=A0A9Q9CAE4_ENCHE|nr:uncharacterized protein EHEL_070610 [Encephalitozoon hellem ATCC 50504]AFM98588.1 hypothetical protein EHEL_070610 [Encephalitozoon hellem ATCC 50504]UTX43532.1 hypothetical protein GPU96_07g12910 [Encephalitozoon hellem]WEL39006.1 hypothetical protein PFJ87_07g00830 [Encephalitozoon hellem]|eukprot:XP_003887569.1 hypothetical protein EHEL_070610 [Encephalitozoon hellem ATCC 50504]